MTPDLVVISTLAAVALGGWAWTAGGVFADWTAARQRDRFMDIIDGLNAEATSLIDQRDAAVAAREAVESAFEQMHADLVLAEAKRDFYQRALDQAHADAVALHEAAKEALR